MRRRSLARAAGLIALAAAAATTAAEAATARFDVNSDAIEDVLIITPYTEAGLTFTVLSGHYDLFGDDDLIDPDTGFGPGYFNIDSGSFDGGDEPTVIEVTFAEGRFDLVSFEVVDVVASGVTITADTGDTLDASTLGLGLAVFTDLFQGVTVLTLTSNTGDFFGLDDFTVAAADAVPLPGAMGFFLAPLAAAGWRRMRLGSILRAA